MKIPFIYILSHIFYGMSVYFLPSYLQMFSIWGVIFYQSSQLFINKRFYPFHLKIVDGNSFIHTINKLGHYSLGYCSTILLENLYKFSMKL